ncbi:MAG: NAD-dependent epimerase/dehydratase family protein [Dehalococcoidia bacterium]|jgi:UDP-glucose 4-epimerase
MKVFVTGGAGFIGSNLVDRLLTDGNEVVAYDNFSTGLSEFLEKAKGSSKFRLIEDDCLNLASLKRAMAGCDFVFHMAANADVRFGITHPEKDLQQNTVATFHILEAMRVNKINKIVFPSTGSIYGEATIVPTPENAPFPVQTSLYGASKLACEGLIEAYCERFGFQAWIFRFVSILGERYTHGHVYDFYKKLLNNPTELQVLGNGSQKKSYLYVHDCLDAILFSISKFKDAVNILNLGTNEYCEVNESIGWITGHLGLKPKLTYSGGDRGWVGDNPFIFLDTTKINNAGWKSKLTIRDSMIKTLIYLQDNRWLMDRRE